MVFGKWVQSSPAVANGVVYVGSRDSNVYCFGRKHRGKVVELHNWRSCLVNGVVPKPTSFIFTAPIPRVGSMATRKKVGTQQSALSISSSYLRRE